MRKIERWWIGRSFISKLLITYIIGLFLLGNANYVNEFVQTQGQFPDIVGNWSPIGAYLITPFFLLSWVLYDVGQIIGSHAEMDVVLHQSLWIKLFVLWFFLIPIVILFMLIWKAFRFIIKFINKL
jgi:hypothetical protein